MELYRWNYAEDEEAGGRVKNFLILTLISDFGNRILNVFRTPFASDEDDDEYDF